MSYFIEQSQGFGGHGTLIFPVGGTLGGGGGTGPQGAQGSTGPQGSGIAAGSTTQVQYNDNGSFAGDSGLVWNKTAGTLSVTGATDAKRLVLQAGGSSANIVEYQNSGGTPVSSIDANGYGFLRPVVFVLGNGTPVTTGTNVTNAVIAERNGKIVKAFIYAKTGPSGAALICDIKKNGTSIWNATPANRIQLASGATSATQTSFDTTTVSEGDVLTIDIAQVGSSTAGQDVTVQLLIVMRNQ